MLNFDQNPCLSPDQIQALYDGGDTWIAVQAAVAPLVKERHDDGLDVLRRLMLGTRTDGRTGSGLFESADPEVPTTYLSVILFEATDDDFVTIEHAQIADETVVEELPTCFRGFIKQRRHTQDESGYVEDTYAIHEVGIDSTQQRIGALFVHEVIEIGKSNGFIEPSAADKSDLQQRVNDLVEDPTDPAAMLTYETVGDTEVIFLPSVEIRKDRTVVIDSQVARRLTTTIQTLSSKEFDD